MIKEINDGGLKEATIDIVYRGLNDESKIARGKDYPDQNLDKFLTYWDDDHTLVYVPLERVIYFRFNFKAE